MTDVTVAKKCENIIDSCQNERQLTVARKYIMLAYKKKNISIHEHFLFARKISEKSVEFYREFLNEA